jgi:predicted ATP-dependent protease
MTGQEIIGQIERELITVMGPLASVIMKEKASQFGTTITDFPENKVAELVEEVSFEIHDYRRKVEFQRAALKILREASQRPAVSEKESELKVRGEKAR